jgi:hypothetical protein
MQNIVMRHSVVAPAWDLSGTARSATHGSVCFALALIVIGIGLTVAAAIFPDFLASNVSHFGPGTP